jgi:small subunit ribosomal protein S6
LSTAVKRLYEGLFLVDSNEAASDWQGVVGAIEKVLSRAEAEVVSLRKWEERKLCYDVKKRGRGTYILVYFNVDTSKITSIERDVQLSEQILRVMILTTDRMTQEDIDCETPQAVSERLEKERLARVAEATAAKEAKAAEAAAEAAAAPVVEEAVEVEATEESPAEEVEVTEAPAEEATEEEK